MLNTAIRASKFSVKYPDSDTYCLEDISFSINRATTTLITGISGSGKTTLMRCISGISPHLIPTHTKGSLEVLGRSIDSFEMYEIARIVGCVFQNPRSQFFTDNVTAEIVFAQENFGETKVAIQNTLDHVSKQFGIEDLLYRDIYTLSQGERQLLAISCSATLDQQILLFDEPSANLDYPNAMRLGTIIKKLNDSGITCIVSDHRFFYLDGVVDKVMSLEDGHLTSYDSQTKFLESKYQYRRFNLFEGRYPQIKNRHISNIAVASLYGVYYKDILKDINLNINVGDICCLIGVNGAGKTTIANILTGYLKPDRGVVNTDGMPFYVAQDPDYQLFGSTVEEEFKLTKHPVADDVIDEVLTSLNLIDLKQRIPFSLSGGEKQRLQIALAKTCNKKLIVFDEPTSGLDSKIMELVATSIKELSKTAGILVITHDYEFIQKVANRICYLSNKTIISDFELNDNSRYQVENIFRKMGDSNE